MVSKPRNEAFVQAAEAGDVRLIQQMLDQGVDVNSCRGNRWTALMAAAAYGKTAAFELLMSNDADVHLVDNFGNTALHHAACGGKVKIIRALLDAGVDVDAANDDGQTPLIAAAMDERVRAVGCLVEAGANVNAQSQGKFSFSALKAAGDNEKIKDLLNQAGAVIDPQHERTVAATVARAAGARQHGQEPEFRQQEIAAFVQAASYGDAAAVRTFLEIGVPVDARNERGSSAIVAAAGAGQREVFDALLRTGAAWEGRDAIMCMAAMGGSLDIVERLLERGIDPDEPDKDNMTPLMWASMQGHADVVGRLLAAGADPNVRVKSSLFPKGGRTALELAEDNRQKEVIPLLGRALGLAEEEFAEDPAFAAARAIRNASKTAEFQAILDRLGEVCGRRPTPWQKRKGVYRCYLPPSSGHRLEDLQGELRAAGFQLVLYDTEPGFRNSAKLMVFPVADKYAVLVARGTNGANYGLSTRGVITWLRNMEKENPFDLTACGFDFLEGRFPQAVRDPEIWAERMLEFCPDCENRESILHEFRQQQFWLWWD